MKFTCSVTIDLPRDKVVELWENPDNLKEWQDGYLGMEHLSGNPGEAGAKSNMRYQIGKRTMVLEETIVRNDLPYEYVGIYAAKEMVNDMSNRFTEDGPNQCTWETEVHYTQLNGFMVKLIAFLFPGMFKKQVQKWLNQFKEFAETGTSKAVKKA